VRVAIMQPYFMPYAGYFRLFAGADLFVAYDCVQFPRRGWVHRNRLGTIGGQSDWLTLPLQKADRDSTRICDLRFRDDARREWQDAPRRFPALRALAQRGGELADCALNLMPYPVDYILSGMGLVSRLLGVERPLIRSSSLDIDPALKGQERILEILRALGAREYVNAPGGRALYDAQAFARAGIKLLFLSEYRGGLASILERLALEDADAVRAELLANLALDQASTAAAALQPGVSAPECGLPAPGF
jgi:hypothetical protein